MVADAVKTRLDAPANASWVQGVLLALPACMVVMTMVAPLPVIPAILKNFAAVPNIGFLTQMAVVVPMLSIALSSVAAGALGDRIGRRRLLDFSTLLFAITAVAPLWLTSFPWILLSRALCGLGLGAMASCAVALTGDYFEGPTREKWLAVQGAAGAGSAVVASVVSGALGEISWRLPFLLLASGFAMFAALLLFRGPATAAVQASADETASQPPSPIPWAPLAAIFSLGVLASLTIWPPVYAFGLVLQEKGVGSALLTGMVTAVLGGGAIVGALGLGLLRGLAAPAKQAVAIAVSCSGILLIWIAASVGPIMAGAFAIGVGQGMTSPILGTWLLDRTPPRLRGRVVGLFQTTFFLAQFAGPLFARWLADASGGTTASMLYFAAASALLVGATVALAMLRRAPPIPPPIAGQPGMT